jgi:hypothetical protein
MLACETSTLLKNNCYVKYEHLDLIIDSAKIKAQSTTIQIFTLTLRAYN